MPVIIFNGKTYADIEEMPVNERQAYERMSQLLVDKNGNGIPDLLEGDRMQNVLAVHSGSARISVNGKVYHTLEDLPPDLRQSVDGAFKMLSGLGMATNLPPAQTPPVNQTPKIETKPFIAAQPSSAIEEDKSPGIFSFVIIGVVLCSALAAAATAVYYFMIR
jgi:hypothetical protein